MNASPTPSCVRCGYDLSGQPLAPPAPLTCPECGERNAGRKPRERYLLARAALCAATTFLAAVIAGYSTTSALIGAALLCAGVWEAIRMVRLARGWEVFFCAPVALLPVLSLGIVAVFFLRSLL